MRVINEHQARISPQVASSITTMLLSRVQTIARAQRMLPKYAAAPCQTMLQRLLPHCSPSACTLNEDCLASMPQKDNLANLSTYTKAIPLIYKKQGQISADENHVGRKETRCREGSMTRRRQQTIVERQKYGQSKSIQELVVVKKQKSVHYSSLMQINYDYDGKIIQLKPSKRVRNMSVIQGNVGSGQKEGQNTQHKQKERKEEKIFAFVNVTKRQEEEEKNNKQRKINKTKAQMKKETKVKEEVIIEVRTDTEQKTIQNIRMKTGCSLQIESRIIKGPQSAVVKRPKRSFIFQSKNRDVQEKEYQQSKEISVKRKNYEQPKRRYSSMESKMGVIKIINPQLQAKILRETLEQLKAMNEQIKVKRNSRLSTHSTLKNF